MLFPLTTAGLSLTKAPTAAPTVFSYSFLSLAITHLSTGPIIFLMGSNVIKKKKKNEFEKLEEENITQMNLKYLRYHIHSFIL